MYLSLSEAWRQRRGETAGVEKVRGSPSLKWVRSVGHGTGAGAEGWSWVGVRCCAADPPHFATGDLTTVGARIFNERRVLKPGSDPEASTPESVARWDLTTLGAWIFTEGRGLKPGSDPEAKGRSAPEANSSLKSFFFLLNLPEEKKLVNHVKIDKNKMKITLVKNF